MHERIEQQKFACDKTQDPRQEQYSTTYDTINLNICFLHI